LIIAAGKTIFDPNIATLLPSQFLQAFLERYKPSLHFGFSLSECRQHADAPHSLLRARRKRPRRRCAA